MLLLKAYFCRCFSKHIVTNIIDQIVVRQHSVMREVKLGCICLPWSRYIRKQTKEQNDAFEYHLDTFLFDTLRQLIASFYFF